MAQNNGFIVYSNSDPEHNEFAEENAFLKAEYEVWLANQNDLYETIETALEAGDSKTFIAALRELLGGHS